MSETIDPTGDAYFQAEFTDIEDDKEWHPDIEESPSYNLNLGGKKVALTRDNAEVYINTHNEVLDHIFIKLDDGKGMFAFRDKVTNFEEAIEALALADFTFIDSHVASPRDVNMFIGGAVMSLEDRWLAIAQDWTDEVLDG